MTKKVAAKHGLKIKADDYFGTEMSNVWHYVKESPDPEKMTLWLHFGAEAYLVKRRQRSGAQVNVVP